MVLLKEKQEVKQERPVTKIDNLMKLQLLSFFYYCMLTGCAMKLPSKINIAERMENGSYREKKIVNQDSIKQVVKFLNQRNKEDKVKFYMQYTVELIYSNKKISYSIGGKYMKSEDGNFYQLNQPDSLLKLLQVQ